MAKNSKKHHKALQATARKRFQRMAAAMADDYVPAPRVKDPLQNDPDFRAEIGQRMTKSKKDEKLSLIPRTPPWYRRTGNLLADLNRMYGPAALRDGKIRAAIRRKYEGQIEVKRINGEWQPVLVKKVK